MIIITAANNTGANQWTLYLHLKTLFAMETSLQSLTTMSLVLWYWCEMSIEVDNMLETKVIERS